MKNSNGFTMIELMIVTAIIGILVTIAMPQYIKYVKRSRSAMAGQHIGDICKTLMEWREHPQLGDGDLPTDTTTTDKASKTYAVVFPAEARYVISGDPYYNYTWDGGPGGTGLVTATAKLANVTQFDAVAMTAGIVDIPAAAGLGSGIAQAGCGSQSMHSDPTY